MMVFQRKIFVAIALVAASGVAQGDVIGFDEFPAQAGEPGSLEALIQSRRPKLPVDLFEHNPFSQIFVAMSTTQESGAGTLGDLDTVHPGSQTHPEANLLIEDRGSLLSDGLLLGLLSLR
jgi:hypothetical protein